MGSGLEGFLQLKRKLEAGGWFPDADLALGKALTEAVVGLGDEVPSRTAIVATGGFGRGSLALRSDVDLMVLVGGRPDTAFIARLFRPLWDAGLRVGHSVRTPAEAKTFAAGRVDAFCALLTSRLVAGDREVFGDFHRRLEGVIRRDARRFLSDIEEEERRRRRAEPYRKMALDLKRGRGGQRTLDAVEWAARLRGEHVDDVRQMTRPLRELLVAVRSGLHACTKRAHDTFDFELREPVARWLGTETAALGGELLGTTREVERLASEVWPKLEQRRLVAVPARPDDPVLAAALTAAESGSQDGLDEALSQWRPPVTWGAADRRGFLDLIRPEADWVMGRLLDSGWVDAVLPEWSDLVDIPHIVPFHRFAVLDHSRATVAEMRALLSGETEVPLVRELAGLGLESEALMWASLLHDIGKRFEGDHCRVGAALAAVCTDRLAIPGAELVTWLVEHHLLLADAATRFDLNDPLQLRRIGSEIGSLDRLRHLYLLTVADSRATGTDTWNAWRAELLRRAYRRLETQLEELPVGTGGPTVADVRVADPGLTEIAVEQHLAGFGEMYRSMHSSEVIASHIRLGASPVAPGEVRVKATLGEATARIIVATRDRPGLLSVLAGVLAIERLSILDARVATRSDGIAFDTFEVTIPEGAAGQERLDAVEARLRRVLRGGFGLHEVVAAKQWAYRHTEKAGIEGAVRVLREPGGGGWVEVESSDRLGLLFDIAEVFVRFAMPVVRAKVDTRAGVAYDTFWVERIPGSTTELEDALRRVL